MTWVLSIVAGAYASVYLELFREAAAWQDGLAVQGLLSGAFDLTSVFFILVTWLIATMLLYALCSRGGGLLRFVDRYRYALGALVIAVCVLASLSGSSIALWQGLLPSGDAYSDALIGIPRAIRSDEWLVNTPFAFSQSVAGYAPISDLIRGGQTDVTLVYAQPSWAYSTLFRPFLWGYLVLGSARGLSFFWCARIVFLFLATYECAKLYTNSNKHVSAVVATVVTFSPIVQWWFAVNGIAELFIFGQYLVVGTDALLKREIWWEKLLVGIVMFWLMCGYLLVLYPAWQVPLFWVFLVMCIWVVVRRRVAGEARGKLNAVVIICALIAAVGSAIVCIALAGDAFSATMNSAYPGKRFSTGGGFSFQLFEYGIGLFSPIWDSLPFPQEVNVCDQATMFSLFPLGLAAAVYRIFKNRDGLLIGLVVVELVLIAYQCIGLPEVLARVTLLSFSLGHRVILAVGFIDVVLLARCFSLHLASAPVEGGSARGLAVATVVAMGLCVCCYLAAPAAFSKMRIMLLVIALAMVCLAGALHVRYARSGEAARHLLCSFIVVVGISGLCVNPVQVGDADLGENESLRTIAEVHALDADALWAAKDVYLGQACAMAGAPCLNTVNAYPNVARWSAVDAGGQAENVYNRYARIDILPTRDDTTFELTFADSFTVHLSAVDFLTLGIGYYVTDDASLSSYSTDVVAFEKVENVRDSLFVYRVIDMRTQ